MENSALNEFIREHLSPERPPQASPDPLLVFEARQTVLNHGKKSQTGQWLQAVSSFFTTEVRMYHLGISMLLMFFSFFYCQRINESSINTSSLSHYSEDAFALTNHTISVTSSTMLTSIPTLVIRN